MSSSKTELLIFFIFFYAILTTLMGFIGASLNADIDLETENSNSVSGFTLSNVVSGIGELPVWFNAIFFGSFIIIISWIILSSLPTINGGS